MAEPGQVGFVYFPLFMNIKDKSFVVFGAGAIAARRLAVLLRYGAKAVVIAPCIHEDIYRLRLRYPGQLRLEERSYDPGEIGRHVIGITSTQGDHKKTAETASLLRRRLGSLLK